MTDQHPQPADQHDTDDRTDGETVARVEMPAWMREHAHRTAADIAAGRAEPLRPDNRAELEARIAELHARIAAAAQAERRAQLTRWHTDDHAHDHGSAAADDDGTGRTR